MGQMPPTDADTAFSQLAKTFYMSQTAQLPHEG